MISKKSIIHRKMKKRKFSMEISKSFVNVYWKNNKYIVKIEYLNLN